MFKLSSKLAVSNLIKNRRLYYPFALATIIATAILYSFISLTNSPNMEQSYGGSAARTTLQFGIYVIQIAVLILVTYANSFVMKNRSRELGLYSILGMEKRHLLSMTFLELLIFYLGTVGLGLGLGLIFDRLLYALLLKIMGMPVVIESSFKWGNLFLTLLSLGLAFAFILLLNSARLLRYSSLHLLKEKKAGEKQGHFLFLQTLLGLGLLAVAFYLALSVEHPVSAITTFFSAVLLVVLATYLLFNAGSITFLQFLKKRKGYYYKTQNFISVSNLISRMRKNAAGLATISILSTMLLVTLTGSISIYIGGKDYLDTLYPETYNITVSEDKADANAQILQAVQQVAEEKGLKDLSYHDYLIYSTSIENISGKHLNLTEAGTKVNMLQQAGALIALSSQDYEKMTGQKLDLADDETAIYADGLRLKADKDIIINDKKWKIKQVISSDFSHGKVPNQTKISFGKVLYMVVKDPNQLALTGMKDYYIGIQSSTKNNPDFNQAIRDKLTALLEQQQVSGVINPMARSAIEKEYQGVVGTLLFIGLFLSIIFLIGTVLVIYYKQISEGYEDRENFIILQKVGLDERQTRATIRKQVLTVFFLPLIFAFVYLAVAFKMLSLILALLGATNVWLLIQITSGICFVFLLAYMLVFLLTSRSYRKIVAR